LLTACSSTTSKPAVRENGVSAISDQLPKIEQQFSALNTDAKGQYSTQIDDLSKALYSLSSSVNAARSTSRGRLLLRLLRLHVSSLVACRDLTGHGGVRWRSLKPGACGDGQGLDTGAEGRFDDGREVR
jgi:hypothetical protein